jgi:hypothetical protein
MTLHFARPGSLSRNVDGLTANFEASYTVPVLDAMNRGVSPELNGALPQGGQIASNPQEMAVLGGGLPSAMSRQLPALSQTADPLQPGVRQTEYATNNEMNTLARMQQNPAALAAYDKSPMQAHDDQLRAINPSEQTDGENFLESVLKGARSL